MISHEENIEFMIGMAVLVFAMLSLTVLLMFPIVGLIILLSFILLYGIGRKLKDQEIKNRKLEMKK